MTETITTIAVAPIVAAAATHAALVAKERHAADLAERRRAARREAQARFDEFGLPRGLYLEV